MTTYQQTHPWISFEFDFTGADPRLWLLLGEAHSKCEHIAGTALRPDVAEELHRVYLAKGVLATTAIEGNTLSEEQVRALLEGKLKLPPSQAYLAQEVENIIKACNFLGETRGAEKITPERIKLFNFMALKGLKLEEGVTAGEYRTGPVLVGTIYRGAPASDCQLLVDRLCEWLNGADFIAPKGLETVYAIIKAVVAQLYLAWIHPFGDGNGRTARLIEFQILLAAGFPSPAAHLLSNHYNLTRSEYYRQLAMASRSGGDILPFVKYAVQGFVDGLKEQLDRIRRQQWDVAWRNFVYEKFRDKRALGDKRRRDLVLDLSRENKPVAIPSVTKLSARIAGDYAGKTHRTLQRDLSILEELGLIERTPKDVRAKREIILAFLPQSAGSSS
jgi:Fic family protein